MSKPAPDLPLQRTLTPQSAQEVAAAVADCHASRTPVYPLGGGTSLAFGLPAKTPGLGLSLTGMNRIIDYPARDMTVTVEAGVTLQTLADTLANERQWLPLDAPQPEGATVGGLVATGWNGPRRFGYAGIRDAVIGIHAVDGRGMPFKGGGRVVKNVAGYDFCKLLTGSLGVLGVITQVTFKLRPFPAASSLLVAPVNDWAQAEKLLAAIASSAATPVAVELLSGPLWKDNPLAPGNPADLHLVLGLEGTAAEVSWMTQTLAAETAPLGLPGFTNLPEAPAGWRSLREFSAAGAPPLSLKANLVPTGVVPFLQACRAVDPACSFLAHAGHGEVHVQLSEFPAAGLARTLIAQLQPVATAHHGNVVIARNPSGAEMTRQSCWGGAQAPYALMAEVKRKFDPHHILNPGRFVV